MTVFKGLVTKHSYFIICTLQSSSTAMVNARLSSMIFLLHHPFLNISNGFSIFTDFLPKKGHNCSSLWLLQVVASLLGGSLRGQWSHTGMQETSDARRGWAPWKCGNGSMMQNNGSMATWEEHLHENFEISKCLSLTSWNMLEHSRDKKKCWRWRWRCHWSVARQGGCHTQRRAILPSTPWSECRTSQQGDCKNWAIQRGHILGLNHGNHSPWMSWLLEMKNHSKPFFGERLQGFSGGFQSSIIWIFLGNHPIALQTIQVPLWQRPPSQPKARV